MRRVVVTGMGIVSSIAKQSWRNHKYAIQSFARDNPYPMELTHQQIEAWWNSLNTTTVQESKSFVYGHSTKLLVIA